MQRKATIKREKNNASVASSGSQVQLTKIQEQTLEIIEPYYDELQEAIKYSMQLGYREAAIQMLTKAEKFQEQIKKVKSGQDLEKKDQKYCKPITSEDIMGFTENERL